MESLRFDGSGWEYFKIWIVNILLVIVTLGLYYPWAKVRNSRYFYANSVLDGRNFEYHATGKQLFLGHLIAIILFIIFATVQNSSPQIGGGLILFVFLAAPWIIWRSFKFNLRMSSFSNVRFNFAGKVGGAYLNYLILPILFFIALYSPVILAVLVSAKFDPMWLAVVLPVSVVAIFYFKALLTKKNTQYMFNHYQYGQGRFATDVQTKTFAWILLKTLGLGILIFALLGMSGAALIDDDMLATIKSLGNSQDMNNPEVMQELLMNGGGALIALLYVIIIFAGLAILAFSTTRQRSYIYAQTNLDDKVNFNSTLTARSLFTMMLTNFILVIVTLGLAIPWAKVRMARLLLNNTEVDAQGTFNEYLTQQQDNQSALGDQIGDAFDINIDLAI